MTGSRIERVTVRVFTIPTATPVEADGTLEWNSTTLILVEAEACGHKGLGYGYADLATGQLIRRLLAPLTVGQDPLSPRACHDRMVKAIRNLGRPGICSMAISAVDVALWDLKAKIHQVPLATLLGRMRDEVEAYGSGGFTSYDESQLKDQVLGWAELGIKKFKIKVGRDRERDQACVRMIRELVGAGPEIFVDANGAYGTKEALREAERFASSGVTWFEEPVPSDDLSGLRLMRDRAPAGMQIAAGEYGYDPLYFRRMLEAQAVDVLQADATRCGGVTGFMGAASLCVAYGIRLSAHTAPSLHAHLCCVAEPAVHVEYFFDHARIEKKFFEGAIEPVRGHLRPNLERAGLGLEFKEKEAEPYEIRF